MWSSRPVDLETLFLFESFQCEVILPRLLLQVRGSASEAVCGLRIRGSLEEKVGLSAAERPLVKDLFESL